MRYSSCDLKAVPLLSSEINHIDAYVCPILLKFTNIFCAHVVALLASVLYHIGIFVFL